MGFDEDKMLLFGVCKISLRNFLSNYCSYKSEFLCKWQDNKSVFFLQLLRFFEEIVFDVGFDYDD